MTVCGLCGRVLKDAESIRRGYGPTCFVKKFGKQYGLGPQGRKIKKKDDGQQYKLPLE